MSIAPRRLSPEASRAAALDAARAILVEEGPQAVTLKAVAARIGRTHANLLHHFGSAAGLHTALAGHMADTITRTIGAAVLGTRAGTIDRRVIVDLTFDAFDREGAGALASWMILSGNRDALNPLMQAIHRLIDDIGPVPGPPLEEVTLALTLLALGDALLGAEMAAALGLPRGAARAIAMDRLMPPPPDQW